MHAHRLARLGRRRDHRLGGEVERDAEHVGIFDVEQAFLVRGRRTAGAAPRPTTCSHRSCVPKARTPRMWVTVLASQPSVSIDTDTTQRICSPSWPVLPTVFMTSRSSVLRRRSSSPACGVAGALDDLAAEPLDLVRRHLAEVLVERLAGFELRAVDQDRVRAGEPVAVIVVVAEQLEAAVFERRRAVVVRRGESPRCSCRRAPRSRCCCRRR